MNGAKKNWNAIIQYLSKNINLYIDTHNYMALKSAIRECQEYIENPESPNSVKGLLTYYVSNAYHALSSANPSVWDNEDIGNALIQIRKYYRFNLDMDEINARVQVNHANILSSLGRYIEAIPRWKQAFKLIGEPHDVGLYRLADGLIRLSNFFYDKFHCHYYQLHAYKILEILSKKDRKTVDKKIASAISKGSHSLVRKFMEYAGDSFKNDTMLIDIITSVKGSKKELAYKKWCLEEVLYVNPLNDLENAWYAAKDSLVFPTYKVKPGEGPYLAAAYSAILNEYCFFRHEYYEGINHRYAKYIDKDKYLIDTLNGVCYNGGVEKIKQALKGCFGSLDKIARLIDKYFELENEGSVGFNRSWFSEQNKLKDKENPFLIALFWLSKDFTQHDDKEDRPSFWMENNAFESRELRNHLEHGWVRVVDDEYHALGYSKGPWAGNEHDYAYTISKSELFEKGLYVLKQTRVAIIYFCLAIHWNEKYLKDDSLCFSELVPMLVN